MLTLAAICAIAAGTVAGPAGATGTCGGSQVFAWWGDSAYYIPMGTVAGTNVYTSGTTQLLGGSGTATYSGSCTSFQNPQLRFFAKNTSNTGYLTATMQYKDAWGIKHNDVVATLVGAYSSPSPIIFFSSTQTNVQVSITAHGGSWQLNGVYLDPYRSR